MLKSVVCGECGKPTGEFIKEGDSPKEYYCKQCRSLAEEPYNEDEEDESLPRCRGCGEGHSFDVVEVVRQYRGGTREDDSPYVWVSDINEEDTESTEITCGNCGSNNIDHDGIEYY